MTATSTVATIGLPVTNDDPDRIRESARQILQRPEFGDHRSIFERVVDWISSTLAGIFGGIFGGSGSGTGFVGQVFQVLLIGFAALLLFLAIRAIWRAARARKAPEVGDGIVVLFGEVSNPADLIEAAENAERDRRFKQALMARYRHLVASLIQQGVLLDVPGRTTGEYRVEFGQVRPDSAVDFDQVTMSFEKAYYGDEPVGAAELEEARRVVALLLAQSDLLVGTTPR